MEVSVLIAVNVEKMLPNILAFIINSKVTMEKGLLSIVNLGKLLAVVTA